jgi:hypothetical protein
VRIKPYLLDCLSTNNLMGIEIRQATAADVDTVSSILLEAANWLKERGMPMWRANELLPERIANDVRDGLFFVANALANRRARPSFSSRTWNSGRMFPNTKAPAFTGSLCGGDSQVGPFPRRSYRGLSNEQHRLVGPTSGWIARRLVRGSGLYMNDSGFNTTVIDRLGRTLWPGTSLRFQIAEARAPETWQSPNLRVRFKTTSRP